MKNIESVVKSNLCLGCGFCTFRGNYKMEYNHSKGLYLPKKTGDSNHLDWEICPAKGYTIKQTSAQLYTQNAQYSIDLGYINKQYVVSSKSERILQNASSGGIMTQIALFLLKEKIVDYVVVTKFIYSENGIKTKTFFTNDINEIFEAQGSKYCPVNMDYFISEIGKYKFHKFAFFGTPCQIAAIREIQRNDPHIAKNLLFTVGNFCGGVKNYNNIKKLAQRNKLDYENIKYFRFRGGGQPGSLLMVDKHGNSSQTNYPLYVGYTGYSKLLRCHLCVDATAELADISCGDAWLDSYMEDFRPWSVIISRNKKATEIINMLESQQKIIIREISKEEISKSQNQNLKSKKYRYLSRNNLYRFLGYKLPDFDGGYHNIDFPLKKEIKIYLIHKLKELLEKIGLYGFVRNIIKK